MIHEEEKVLVDGISLPDTRTSTAMRTESLVKKGFMGARQSGAYIANVLCRFM